MRAIVAHVVVRDRGLFLYWHTKHSADHDSESLGPGVGKMCEAVSAFHELRAHQKHEESLKVEGGAEAGRIISIEC